MKRNLWMRTITLFLFAQLKPPTPCAEDPKAAARALGNAGRTAAAAFARDPASTSKVPGYAGNEPCPNVAWARPIWKTQRTGARRSRRSGRAAGRAVIEGMTARPEASVGTDDPILCAARRSRKRSRRFALRRLGPGVGVRLWTARGTRSGGIGRFLRLGQVVRRRGLRNHPFTGKHRLRGRGGQAQHGAGTGRRGIRPGEPPLLPGRAQIVPDQVGRAGELLQGLGPPHRSRRLHRGRAPPRAGAPRRENALPGHAVRQAHIRGLRAQGAGLVRLRLQARPHPSGGGAVAARHRLEQLPGFTVEEMERIDFEAVDLSEFTANLMDGSSEPSIALPDSGDTGSVMRGESAISIRGTSEGRP